MKISENHDEIWKNRTFFSVSNLENAKKIDEHLLKYWGLGGANACKSCRSRQELSSEYFLATFGFDTADNEPDNTPPRDLIFTDIPRPLIFVQLLERADTRPGSLQSDIRICYRMRSKNIDFPEQQRICTGAQCMSAMIMPCTSAGKLKGIKSALSVEHQRPEVVSAWFAKVA